MSIEYVHVDVMSRDKLSMLTLCQGNRSMSTSCQWYVKGGGPCQHWLPLSYVKHIFYFLLIESEYVHVDVMSRDI